MKEALMATMKIVGWLGVILGILVMINSVCGAIFNTHKNGDKFSWGIFFKGIGKAIVFYGCSAALAVAFTILPFVNNMITDVYGVQLIAEDTLTTLSTVAVLGVVINAVLSQGKKALEGIGQLLQVKVGNTEVITWEVIEPEEEDRKEK